jgi:hypothetical protein
MKSQNRGELQNARGRPNNYTCLVSVCNTSEYFKIPNIKYFKSWRGGYFGTAYAEKESQKSTPKNQNVSKNINQVREPNNLNIFNDKT